MKATALSVTKRDRGVRAIDGAEPVWYQDGFRKATQLEHHHQKRPYGAAVTHLQLVCLASALLTHLRIERAGAQGSQTRHKAAALSTAAAQEQLQGLIWEDLMAYLQEQCHGESALSALERLRVA